MLIDKGAEVDACDAHGLTPLHWAAKEGHAALVKLLLAEGADPHRKDHRNRPPLEWARNARRPEAAAVLEAAGDRR